MRQSIGRPSEQTDQTSHTVATTLVFSLLQLVKDQEMQTKIRQQIGPFNSWNDGDGLASLEIFNTFINETMRLYPAVPTGGIRMTQEEGVVIGDTFIPAETTIVPPAGSLVAVSFSTSFAFAFTLRGLVESCFERADDFIPKRWTTKPEMIKEKRPYNLFNNGGFYNAFLFGS